MVPASVSVVLPVLNEATAIPQVLAGLPAGYLAMVVDNGSTDASAAIAQALGAQVIHEPQRGFGAACAAGLAAARTDVVAFCDCDGSLDLADLPRICDPVLDGRARMVLGARVPTQRGAWPRHAQLANRYLARRLRRSFGLPLTDLGPMRAARRDDWESLDVEDRRSGWPLEQVVRAALAGWDVAEVRVPYRPRSGRSKVTGTARGTAEAIRDMHRVLRTARPPGHSLVTSGISRSS